MPLSWTQTIEQSQILRSDAISEIKTNMDITYDKICYTDNSNIYTSKFNTVYTSDNSFERGVHDISENVPNNTAINSTEDYLIFSTVYIYVCPPKN